MSHHSEEMPDNFRKFAESLELGPTKQFPQGKLNESDEGELKLGVTHENGKVILNFGKPVAWVGFDPDQALQVAQVLINHAAAARS